MRMQIALGLFATIFGIAVACAAATTVHQVKTDTSSLFAPSKHT